MEKRFVGLTGRDGRSIKVPEEVMRDLGYPRRLYLKLDGPRYVFTLDRGGISIYVKPSWKTYRGKRYVYHYIMLKKGLALEPRSVYVLIYDPAEKKIVVEPRN